MCDIIMRVGFDGPRKMNVVSINTNIIETNESISVMMNSVQEIKTSFVANETCSLRFLDILPDLSN